MLYDSLTGKQTYEAKSEKRILALFGKIACLDGFYYPRLDNKMKIIPIYAILNQKNYSELRTKVTLLSVPIQSLEGAIAIKVDRLIGIL